MGYNPLFTGSQGSGSSVSIVSNYYNATGLSIAQGTPLSKTGVADQIAPTDPTNDTSVHSFVGIAQARIANGTSGPVLSNGRLLNIQGYSFNIGDTLWVGLNGILQNVRPDYGVTGFQSGDFVYFIGVICQNEENSLIKDLQVMPQLVGEL